MINRSSRLWTQDNSEGASFTNNRRQYWGHDAEGHATTVGDSYGYDVTAKPTSYAAAWIGNQRALEVASSYEGSGAPAKQVQTTREGFYDDYGQWQVSTVETTSYYLRSTALGGKVVAELEPNGARMKNHLYAGGMELAQPFVYQNTTYVNWQHTDPVTGSSFTTDTSRTLASQKELGTLGEDVTNPPPPSPRMPVFFQPTWPIEYTGGPSDEFGIPDWYVNMAMTGWDEHLAENMHSIKRDDLAAAIVAHNPNVGIIATGAGVGLLAELTGGHLINGSLTLWGEDAAKGLGFLPLVNEIMPQDSGPTRAQTNARNLLGDCRVHALLDTLAYSEGADYNTVVMGTVIKAPGHPELVGKTNVTVPDFSNHPNILVY